MTKTASFIRRLGNKDEHGFYRITGRLKDMIIRGGENIYPRKSEEFLRVMPQIKDIQVAGVPDTNLGEITRSIYHPERWRNIDREDVLEYCRGKIAKYKTPSACHVC